MAIPDYMTDKNSVLEDKVEWRNGKPNYTNANTLFEKERTKIHPTGSLEELVTNLVKNWEKEASHKLKAEEWRTIDHKLYKFSTNGGPWSTAEDMLKIGTYNALIGESEFYSAKRLNLHESHDVFRNSLSTGFAWEVLEVYSVMAEPTNEVVEIFGITVATINDKYQIISLETFYDPADLMKQMVKNCPIANH
ncbi:6101_t:CDS:2 [Scutellospora calospora]|uniref:6101_t:CDS:1 n=1 Tax=Scutellospora calospora TaxID=85575 RepID=A0ACA9L7G0_9GLOM|nr:6101_t:CDS:2 [Scutellospora calospora]